MEEIFLGTREGREFERSNGKHRKLADQKYNIWTAKLDHRRGVGNLNHELAKQEPCDVVLTKGGRNQKRLKRRIRGGGNNRPRTDIQKYK